jgi:Flp pilus assembly protein TadD
MSTTPLRREGSRRRRRVGAFLALALAAAALCGCRDFGDVTGSLTGSSQAMPSDDASLRAYADHWGKVYDSNPGEKYASMNYAQALRALTRYSEATAVMEAAAVKAPKDFQVLGAYGKALADSGRFEQARDVLTRAYPAERPDWTILSVQGSVADRLNDHDGAQRFYREALKIAPGEPNVLSNLGLSYALTKQLGLAEDALRQAAASPRADSRVRQNLALVLALDGKFAEAEQVSRQDMSAEAAARNVQAIREMIAQNDSWKTLQSGARKSRGMRSSAAPAAMPLGPAPG